MGGSVFQRAHVHVSNIHLFRYRLLLSLETLVDAYPMPDSVPLELVRGPFRYLLAPSLAIGMATTLSAGPDNTLSVADVDNAVAKVELDHLPAGEEIIFGLYTTPSLFIRRAEYLEENNRTSFVLGSAVASVRFRGRFVRSSTRVVITLRKTALAMENGTKTECSFWDQSLDSGYGAWSTDGCRLRSESRSEAVCECNHLTQFALVVVS